MTGKVKREDEFFLLVFETGSEDKSTKLKSVCEVFDEIGEQLREMIAVNEYIYETMRYANRGCMLIMLNTYDAEKKLRGALGKIKGIKLLDLHKLDELLRTTFDEFIKAETANNGGK